MEPVEIESLIENLSNMHYVVGYQLPISPSKYTVDITKGNDNSSIIMNSSYDVSKRDACCIPFCCLVPLCHKRKHVTDHFDVNEVEGTLTLQSTSAFCGLISWIEKGKVFQVIRTVHPYIILVNPKEVFVLSPNKTIPSADAQTDIHNKIMICPSSPKSLHLVY